MANGLLNTKEVAALLGVSADTMMNWRKQKKGPPYVHMVGRFWYRQDQIAEWQRQNTEWCELRQAD